MTAHSSSRSARNPRKQWAVRLLPALITALLLLCSPAMALPPQKLLMAPQTTSIRAGDIFLNLSLTVDNEDGLRDLLKDGAVLQLGITVSVSRKRSWWSNVELAHREYRSIIRHDPLSREFVLELPSDGEEKTLRDKNLTRLLHASWRKLSLYVAPLRTLRAEGSGEEFVIACEVSLQHTEVPPWLEKSSIFWSSDVVPPEKRELPFRLPAGPDDQAR